MSHPYDASTKYLIQVRLPDLLPLVARPTGARVELVDADLATVTAAADRVLRVHDAQDFCNRFPQRPAQPRRHIHVMTVALVAEVSFREDARFAIEPLHEVARAGGRAGIGIGDFQQRRIEFRQQMPVYAGAEPLFGRQSQHGIDVSRIEKRKPYLHAAA